MQHPIDPAIDFNSIRDAIESMLVGRDQLVDDRDMQNILIALLEYSRQQRAVCQNPYINNATNTWYVYDSNGNPYDTNVSAEGTIIRQTEAQSIEGDPRVTLTQIDPMKPNEMKMTIYIPKGERGEPGSVVTIVDGYWYIDGVNTGVVATGEAPTISEDGYWVIGGEKTEFKAVGTDGRDGVDGQNGADGYSPTATVVKTGNTATIEITDKNGTTTATISDGTVGTLNTNNTSAATPTSESMSGNISLHRISKTGNYTDLSNRPIIGNAELTIQSADNATPETYTTIGTFHANASNPEYITLSKVARTGEYNDLIGKPTVSPVFDSMEMFSSIDRWPVNYVLNMNRIAAISHNITDLNHTYEPLILLYYGKSNEQRIKYIPLPPSRTQLMEFTISATSLMRSTSSYSSQYYGSVTFWVVAETDADSGVIRAQIGRMRFNGVTSDDVAVIYQDGLVSPLIQNVNFVDYTVTPLPGAITIKDTIYDVENDNINGDTDSVYVCIAKDENNIKRLIVGLSSNDTDKTYGYSMNCSIRVMNTEAFKSSYEVSEVEQITPSPRS